MSEEYNEHVPVMLEEVLQYSNLKNNSVVIDMTLGRCGHSKAFLNSIPSGHLYGVDRDSKAITYAEGELKKYKNVDILKAKFSEAPLLLNQNYGLEKADFIFYDLGVSSPQFDDPSRGFSYRYDSPLDIRMDQIENRLTAKEVVNSYEPSTLVKAIFEYADEIYAKQIVRNIVKHRKQKPIETTFELVEIIKEALPKSVLYKDKHPAKKTFLAIRYLVNQEKDEILFGIPEGIRMLDKGGRLEVLTFNSYEDGLVKKIFKQFTSILTSSKYLPPENKSIDYKLVTKKPLEPSLEEIERNKRAKPAKLRIIERIK